MFSSGKNGSMSRRTFGKLTAGALGGAFALPQSGQAMSKLRKPTPVGLQLYTLRGIMADDFTGTLRRVAEMGYDAVEFAGFGGLAAGDLKELLDELGLKVAGSHESYEGLSDDADSLYDYSINIGNKNVVCAYMPNQFQRGGVEAYRQFARDLNGFGAKAKDMGLTFLYHNHSFEFEKAPDGSYLMDALLAVADPALVKNEIDTAWAYRAGVDVPAYLHAHADRIRMLHIKDYADPEGRRLTPVGEGIVPIQAIIDAGKDIDVEWFIVEQDTITGDPLTAVETSLKNMRKFLA